MRTLLKRLRKECAYILIRLIVGFFRLLPRRAALMAGAFAGRIAPFAARRDFRLAKQHLTLAFGEEKTESEIESLARDVFRSLALNFVDTVRIKVMTAEEIRSVCIPHNLDCFMEEYRKGKGVIVLSGHTGCWEMMGMYLASIGINVDAITRKLYDPRLERLLFDSRVSGGINVISRGENTREILRALKNGHMLGILIDQDIKVKGEFVDFFGRPAFTAVAPALLSLRYRIPIFPIFTYRDEAHMHHICIGDPVVIEPGGDKERDIKALTAMNMRVTEDFIRAHPEQWVWFHRRWKTKPKTASENKIKDTHENSDG